MAISPRIVLTRAELRAILEMDMMYGFYSPIECVSSAGWRGFLSQTPPGQTLTANTVDPLQLATGTDP